MKMFFFPNTGEEVDTMEILGSTFGATEQKPIDSSAGNRV